MPFESAHRVETGLIPCLYCGLLQARRVETGQTWSHFRCRNCGGYRVSATAEAMLRQPGVFGIEAGFHRDADGTRWLRPG